ncbi:MAG: selenium cofactor biosynthesis protein YqeC [Actinomycetota bacterium]
MMGSLAERMGLGPHELVAIVGAGGKSTILHALGEELAGEGARVVLTTTTMLAESQVTEPACWSDVPSEIEARLFPGVPLFVAAGRVPEKVTGPSTTAVDRIFVETSADYVIVEADGARHMSIKAPAEHEPVVPEAATTVIVTVGIDAIGRCISAVAHRPERVAALAGLAVDDVLTVEGAATVLVHPEGGLKSIPDSARVVMAITKVAPETRETAQRLSTVLGSHSSVSLTITLPRAEDS